MPGKMLHRLQFDNHLMERGIHVPEYLYDARFFCNITFLFKMPCLKYGIHEYFERRWVSNSKS